jgi:hypothetical protein
MGFGVFTMIPMGGGDSIHLGPHFVYYLFLTAKKHLIFKIKLPDPIMKIITILTKTAEC